MNATYRFTELPIKGSQHFSLPSGIPLYDGRLGFGFVEETCAMPARKVHTHTITADGMGCYIREDEFEVENDEHQEHDNHYGMAFRLDAPPGAYEIAVKIAQHSAEPWISISGMNARQLLNDHPWDAAGKVKRNHMATYTNGYWRFHYVNGRSFIDIEVEPKHRDELTGIEVIHVKSIPPRERSEGRLPTIFLLGDSTVKTYTFDEAPMSGWGQVFDHLFDLNRIRVVNYSTGGRSCRNAYAEGRLNDLLLSGCVGDYVFIQLGHNDEREDEYLRFGRGSTEEMYESYIADVYIPAIRARGMIPVLVTPLSRVNGVAKPGHVYESSFKMRDFPKVMTRVARKHQIPIIDLNTASIHYYNEIGVEATTAMFMSIEAGETPGKTKNKSYANGHPANKVDGTHYKEALSKQFSRLIATQLYTMGQQGHCIFAEISLYLKSEVKHAILTNDWSQVYPEIAKDTTTGPSSYYRNQIEKMLQLEVMEKDKCGCFQPDEAMYVQPFIQALSQLLELENTFNGYGNDKLTREVMGAILYDAYDRKFKSKPAYMTDYNDEVDRSHGSHHDPNDHGMLGINYDPILPFKQMTDTHLISPSLKEKVRMAYGLGLFRSEKNIVRGKYMNGTEFEPKLVVSRAKAAKALYFMWILNQPVLKENHLLD